MKRKIYVESDHVEKMEKFKLTLEKFKLTLRILTSLWFNDAINVCNNLYISKKE
jgi:hypothetical protein